jgi:glc operon protein GlcG
MTMNVTRLIPCLSIAAVLVALTMPALAGGTARSEDRITYLNGDITRAAFEKGKPLIETAAYKVHASRRDAAGIAEIHALDTDIIYVLDGTATIVTGGTAVAAKEVAPNEIRGSMLLGGSAQHLAKGDVFIVPNGVPHWFKDVQGPFLYYVVKTTSLKPAGGAQ